ncbi:MAG TPA: hypothetical protein VFT59_00625, partial [Candidatus Saccharimonadales bacterium]|nr:hypothetical protein [Candidatus Saccharimonadales bacterium]
MIFASLFPDIHPLKTKVYSRLFLPLLLAAIIVGLAYTPASAYTAIRALPKITMDSTGFYNTMKRTLFIPRGTNFVRLATSPTGVVYHSTFEPGQYNSAAIQAVLNGMKNSGYNTVRVFIDPGEFTEVS